MGAFNLGPRSLSKLVGVHPDLVRVVHRAISITDVDFVVTEGLRTLARQKQLVAAGASQTMKSRHLTGHAVDLAACVAGQVRWDWPLYARLNEVMMEAARDEGVQIEWGGSWTKGFRDGPHFQLDWKSYPA